jgi:hypothetical protein
LIGTLTPCITKAIKGKLATRLDGSSLIYLPLFIDKREVSFLSRNYLTILKRDEHAIIVINLVTNSFIGRDPHLIFYLIGLKTSFKGIYLSSFSWLKMG